MVLYSIHNIRTANTPRIQQPDNDGKVVLNRRGLMRAGLKHSIRFNDYKNEKTHVGQTFPISTRLPARKIKLCVHAPTYMYIYTRLFNEFIMYRTRYDKWIKTGIL